MPCHWVSLSLSAAAPKAIMTEWSENVEFRKWTKLLSGHHFKKNPRAHQGLGAGEDWAAAVRWKCDIGECNHVGFPKPIWFTTRDSAFWAHITRVQEYVVFWMGTEASSHNHFTQGALTWILLFRKFLWWARAGRPSSSVSPLTTPYHVIKGGKYRVMQWIPTGWDSNKKEKHSKTPKSFLSQYSNWRI